jgi:hypothetical protein
MRQLVCPNYLAACCSPFLLAGELDGHNLAVFHSGPCSAAAAAKALKDQLPVEGEPGEAEADFSSAAGWQRASLQRQAEAAGYAAGGNREAWQSAAAAASGAAHISSIRRQQGGRSGSRADGLTAGEPWHLNSLSNLCGHTLQSIGKGTAASACFTLA